MRSRNGTLVVIVTLLLVLPSLIVGGIPRSMEPAFTDDRSPGPDLMVHEIAKKSPAFPKVGDNVTFNATIWNVGDANATNVTAEITATNDSLAQDIDIGIYHMGSEWGGENITNDSSNNPVVLDFHWNTSQTGFEVEEGLVYTINVTVHDLLDDNLTNGTAFMEIEFGPPDEAEPYVNEVTVAPSEVIIGETMIVNASFKNSGTLEVQDDPVFFYLDYDDWGQNEEIHNTTITIEGLLNSEEVFVEFGWNTTGYSVGNHTITVLVPSTGSNLTTDNLTVLEVPPPPQKPDLTITGLDLNRTAVLQGENINLTVTVENVGNESSIGTTANMTDLDGIYTEELDIPALAPGGMDVQIITIETMDFYLGTHRLQAWVDKVDTNDEENEANNTRTVSFLIYSKPDLVVSEPIFFSDGMQDPVTEVLQGETATISVTVNNIGLNSSVNGTLLNYYLDGANRSFANKTLLRLAAGASYNYTQEWNTSGIPGGVHMITVEVDVGGLNDEMDEDNNVASSNVTIREPPKIPDLTIKNPVLDDETISTGESTILNLVVENIGEGLAEDIELEVIMETTSGAFVMDLGNTVVPYMAGHTEQLISVEWSLDEEITLGEYVIKATLDPDDKIVELDEDNNHNTTGIEIVEKFVPVTDLLIQEVVFEPEKPQKGKELIIEVTVINRGNVDATDVYVRVTVDDEVDIEKNVPLIEKENGTVVVEFNRTFEKPGSHEVRISIFEKGVSKYSVTEEIEVKDVVEDGLDRDMLMSILVLLLVFAIIMVLLKGRGRPKDEGGEEDMDEMIDLYGEEGLTEEEMLAEE